MRDLDFWFRVFAATRGERIEEAKRVADAYGLPMRDPSMIVEMFEKGDAMQLERVALYEAAFGANREAPSAAYIEAKSRAERLLLKEAA